MGTYRHGQPDAQTAQTRLNPFVTHLLSSATTRWRRRARLALLRSGSGCLPCGCSVLMGLPVFCSTRRAPGLAGDYRLGASLASAKLFLPLALPFLAVAVELFTLWPLISAILVLEAFLYALLKFEGGWSAGWLLCPGGFFDSGYGFWSLTLLCRPAGQRNGTVKNNSFGIP